MRSNICCLNCGNFGHTTRICNFPITSYGLVCFKKTEDDIKYIMIQKKDTISYTEFIRGKYEVSNLNYLIMLFSHMTEEEKQQIMTLSFKELWNKLWINNFVDAKFLKEYNKSQDKFCRLKYGFQFKRVDGTLLFINIKYINDNSGNMLEQEWEFPKGRRKLHETDVDCSIREFREEVGLREEILIHDNSKQFEEIFQGSNNIRYRNIYYIAEFLGHSDSVKFDSNNGLQVKEVRDVKLFSYDEVLSNIEISENSEKKELFKRLHNIIKKNYLM